MDYTQDQIDKLIADSTSEATKDLLTQSEFDKKLTSEVDRRVESGITKGMVTQRAKLEKEISEKAKLSAEELANKEFADRLAELELQEFAVKKQANKLSAKAMLSDKGIPKSAYDKIIDTLVIDDETVTNTNVANFIELFEEMKLEVTTSVKAEQSKIPSPPNKSGKGESLDKGGFAKLGYRERLQFKLENPEAYKQLIK